MNAALCTEIGGGAFPTPQQVLKAGVDVLQSRCGVGYRAKTICSLAQQVRRGSLFENPGKHMGRPAAAFMPRLVLEAGADAL